MDDLEIHKQRFDALLTTCTDEVAHLLRVELTRDHDTNVPHTPDALAHWVVSTVFWAIYRTGYVEWRGEVRYVA